MFYIISLKHTAKGDEFLTLWRANNQGYCNAIQAAGRYEKPVPDYHDNEGNLPLMISGGPAVFLDYGIDPEGGLCIRNNPGNRKILKIDFKKGVLKKI